MSFDDYIEVLGRIQSLPVRAGVLYDAQADPEISWEQLLDLMALPT